MMKKIILLLLLVFFVGLTNCNEDGNNPSNNEDDENTSQYQKINTKGWVDSPWISRDGNKLYFMYSRYNFFPAILRGESPFLEGPNRQGHHNNDINPWNDSDIYVATRQSDGSWSEPLNLGSNDDKGDCCHILVSSPDRLYLTNPSPDGTNMDIGYKELAGDIWGGFVNLGSNINSDFNEDNPHILADQQGIYFTRWNAADKRDIWFSWKDGGVWQEAVMLPFPINTTDNKEDQFFISEVGDNIRDVYFNRDDKIFHSLYTVSTDTFSTPEEVIFGLDFVGEASLSDSGDKLYFASGDPETEIIRIMVSSKKANGEWGIPVPVD